MTPLAQRVGNAVCQNWPTVLCFTCLAAQQELNEHDVRAVALVLTVRAGLRLSRRLCTSCQRVQETLLAADVA
jgi:hypothetical protein